MLEMLGWFAPFAVTATITALFFRYGETMFRAMRSASRIDMSDTFLRNQARRSRIVMCVMTFVIGVWTLAFALQQSSTYAR